MDLTFYFVAVCMVKTISASIVINKNTKIIDLTHELNENIPVWGLISSFEMRTVMKMQTKDYWFETYNFSMPEHGGSHIDAPSHFAKGKLTVDKVPLLDFIGPGVNLDVRDKVAKNNDYLVSVNDIQEWERDNGRIPEGAIVLVNTGWAKFWPNASLIFGSNKIRQPETYHHPGLHPDAAKWLVKHRPTMKVIGTDAPSIDSGQTKKYECHTILAAKNKPILEFVNIKTLPKNFVVIAMPIKIGGGSGSPSRIVAIETSVGSFNSNICALTLLTFLCYVILLHID